MGDCSLRAAIKEANATPNGAAPDKIHFTNIPTGIGGVAVITLTSAALPLITDPVVIEAKTAPWAVRVDGINTVSTSGFRLAGAGGSTIRGLTIGNFDHHAISLYSDNNVIQENRIGAMIFGIDFGNGLSGIDIHSNNNIIGGIDKGNVIGFNKSEGIGLSSANNNIIRGNYIGVDVTGRNIGNHGDGMFISSSDGNIIGGFLASQGNTIGNSERGMYLWNSNNNTIRNNYIGTDDAGNNHDINSAGIYIHSGDDNTIGGLALLGNVIGNCQNGIRISGSNNNKVRGNFIGLSREGQDMGNVQAGISIEGLAGYDNKIGYHHDAIIPPAAPKGNTIAYNGEAGVIVDRVGLVGDVARNTIRGNKIYNNIEMGIDLEDDGATVNDVDDSDDAANRLLNYPDIDRVYFNENRDLVIFRYSLSSDSTIVPYPLTVDFYIADDSVSGEGKTYIGTDIYATQGELITFGVDTTGLAIDEEEVFVATATDTLGNTSEFSPATEPVGVLSIVASFSGPSDQLVPSPATETYHPPAKPYLSAAYPNPFNPTTTFTLTVKEQSPVRITIHDLLGRQVAMLHDGELVPDLTYTFTFDGAGLASGTYLLRVEGGRFVETRRLMLLK